ncbi:MAG TPA: hypothetical protein VMM38_06605 [Aridibacter sp.]|nr:hypothetical protein [Aridibacter sp.]
MKFTSYEFTNCEDEIALLDKYSLLLAAEESKVGFVIIYGTESHFSEIKVRAQEIVRYLVKIGKLSRDRLIVFHGGEREKIAIELWVSSSSLEMPFVSVPRSVVHSSKLEQQDTYASCEELF